MKYLHHQGRRIIAFLLVILIVFITAYAQQKGKASYYSRKSNGNRTSSGVRLNNDSLVCAHRSYDFGTLLLVKNPANGKEVVVKVIDRGPHSRGRIIDLSYEAARRLGILVQGVAMVEVSVYDDTTIPYKPKEYKLPELDLEVQEQPDIHNTTPEWQKQQTVKHESRQTTRQSDRQTDAQQDIKPDKQETKHSDKQTGKQETTHSNKQTGKQAGKQETKQESTQDKNKKDEGIHRRRTGADTR